MSAEQKFRIGASHGAEWLHKQTCRMVARGDSSARIAARLGDLVQVLLHWRESQREMPEGNPWEWKEEVLSDYISSHKAEWEGSG